LKKEGLMLLYRTSLGLKIIKRFGEKHKKLLTFLDYVSVILGFILMITMLYFFGKIIWIYVFQTEIVKVIKVPPIVPLLPYLPQALGWNFLPPFYFIYWIIIIALIAIPHEFFHGIFAAHKKVKIKSTGFGFFPFFLPVFLAAFVEQDEKEMEKKKIFSQMSILSAGTFANVLTAIFFLIILVIFFSLSFTAAGVSFDNYPYSLVGIAGITSINGIHIDNASYDKVLNMIDNENINEIEANNSKFLITKDFLERQQGNDEYVFLYDDAPAVKENLGSIIVKINGVDVRSRDELANELLKYSPGDEITITTFENKTNKDYEIVLDENPEDESVPYLGIGFTNQQQSGILSRVVGLFSSFRKPNVYYKPNYEFAEFIYNLLWWLILISFSVALVNMLPVGIFDGGRFFYLTILALTKSKEKAKKAFKFVTYLFLFLLLVIMIFWAIKIFG